MVRAHNFQGNNIYSTSITVDVPTHCKRLEKESYCASYTSKEKSTKGALNTAVRLVVCSVRNKFPNSFFKMWNRSHATFSKTLMDVSSRKSVFSEAIPTLVKFLKFRNYREMLHLVDIGERTVVFEHWRSAWLNDSSCTGFFIW